MKMNTAKNELQTNGEFESKDFGIADPSMVIRILRKHMYAHPIRTLVQEYLCNGRDAIREAGNAGKLKVQLPTRFDSTFKVRDYGVGITPDRMAKVFTMYGASTKRETNGQTGGFGIGAKSAWAYTDSFTIVTFVDGVKRSYVAHVGANDNGRLDLIDTQDTKEENGTEIQIAVKPNDVWAFKNAVLRAVYFWADHEKPEVKGAEGSELNPQVNSLKISSEVEAFTNLPSFVNDNDATLHLIIDGVVYSLESGYIEKHKELKKLFGSFSHSVDVAVKLPNGIVEVSASRESIADSDKSRNALAAMAERWHKQVVELYTSHFKGCKTVFDFAKVYRGFQGMLNKSALPNNFKGFTFDDYSGIRHAHLRGVNLVKISETTRRRRGYNQTLAKEDVGLNKSETHAIDINMTERVYYVDTQESKVNLNKRIRALLKMNPNILLLDVKAPTPEPTPGRYDNGKVSKQAMDDWKAGQPIETKDMNWLIKELEIKKISSIEIPVETKEEKERRKKEKGVISVHFAEWSQKIHDVNLGDLDGRKFVYAPLEYDRTKLAELKDFVKEETGAELCRLSKGAIDKIEDDENFSTLESFLSTLKVSDKMRKARMSELAKNLERVNGLRCIKDELKAKDVKKTIEAYEEFRLGKKMSIPEVIRPLVDEDKEVKAFVELDTEFTTAIDDKYPLLKEISLHYVDSKKLVAKELVFYINAKN